MPPDIFTGALMALSLIIQRRLTPQMGGLVCSGIAGRFAPDWVADLKRNQWPVWTGILREVERQTTHRLPAPPFLFVNFDFYRIKFFNLSLTFFNLSTLEPHIGFEEYRVLKIWITSYCTQIFNFDEFA